MQIEIQASNKQLMGLVVVLVIVAVIGYVESYNEGTPTVTGHHWNDIGGRPAGLDDGDDDTLGSISCANGQIIKYSTGTVSWGCTDESTSSDTNANTQCSGTYVYLSGEGQCRDVRSDGDIYDTDTNTWRPRGIPVYESCCCAGLGISSGMVVTSTFSSRCRTGVKGYLVAS